MNLYHLKYVFVKHWLIGWKSSAQEQQAWKYYTKITTLEHANKEKLDDGVLFWHKTILGFSPTRGGGGIFLAYIDPVQKKMCFALFLLFLFLYIFS